MCQEKEAKIVQDVPTGEQGAIINFWLDEVVTLDDSITCCTVNKLLSSRRGKPWKKWRVRNFLKIRYGRLF